MSGLPLSGVWGKPEVVKPGNPAAGTFFGIAVPANEQWFVWSVAITLATEGTAGNRGAIVQCEAGGIQLFQMHFKIAQPASTVAQYFFQLELPDDTVFEAIPPIINRAHFQMPKIVLPPSSTLFVIVLIEKPLDQLSNPALVISRSYL